MGVAGAGKTTLGRALADRLGWVFEDADDHHSPASIQKMARGDGLTDADRRPWLDRLGVLIRTRLNDGPPTVLACSALKADYRDRLGVGESRVRLVWLDVPRDVLRRRLAERRGHIAGPDLLASQLATLEPPSQGLRLDATDPVDVLTEAVADWIGG